MGDRYYDRDRGRRWEDEEGYTNRSRFDRDYGYDRQETGYEGRYGRGSRYRDYEPGERWGRGIGSRYERDFDRDYGYTGSGYGRGWDFEGGYGSRYDYDRDTDYTGGYGRYGGAMGRGYGGYTGYGRGYGRGGYGRGGYEREYGPERGRFGEGYFGGYDYDRDYETYGGARGYGGYNREYGYGRGGYDIDFGEEPSYTTTEIWYMPGPYTGMGPQGYTRSDERIREDIYDRLTQHGQLDARNIQVDVNHGEVVLRGHVDSRRAKRMAEDTVETVMGVTNVRNEIKIQQQSEMEMETHTQRAQTYAQEQTGTHRQSQMRGDESENP